jgi:hypothetical protein
MPKYWTRNSLKERDDIFNNKLNLKMKRAKPKLQASKKSNHRSKA